MTAPGRHAERLANLPDRLDDLMAAIQGLLLHASWARAYGLDGAPARHTMPIAERLDDILRRNAAPLTTARPPDQRSTGSCRDFALLLCSALRSKAIPARVRCGFADYFDTVWEDHWVCEYWHAQSQTWRLADAQIDAMLRQWQGIAFDATDMPRSAFLTAGEAWRAGRDGAVDFAAFGHGDTTGQWFVAVNVVRDHLSLSGTEISAWDRWREATAPRRRLSGDDLVNLDSLAADPTQPLSALEPAWLTT